MTSIALFLLGYALYWLLWPASFMGCVGLDLLVFRERFSLVSTAMAMAFPMIPLVVILCLRSGPMSGGAWAGLFAFTLLGALYELRPFVGVWPWAPDIGFSGRPAASIVPELKHELNDRRKRWEARRRG